MAGCLYLEVASSCPAEAIDVEAQLALVTDELRAGSEALLQKETAYQMHHRRRCTEAVPLQRLNSSASQWLYLEVVEPLAKEAGAIRHAKLVIFGLKGLHWLLGFCPGSLYSTSSTRHGQSGSWPSS